MGTGNLIDQKKLELFIEDRISNPSLFQGYINICSIIYYTSVNQTREGFRILSLKDYSHMIYTDKIDNHIEVKLSKFKSNYEEFYVKEFYEKALNDIKDLKVTEEFRFLYEELNDDGRELVDKYLESVCQNSYFNPKQPGITNDFRSDNYIKWYISNIFFEMLLIHYITTEYFPQKREILYESLCTKNEWYNWNKRNYIYTSQILAVLISLDNLLCQHVENLICEDISVYPHLVHSCLLTDDTKLHKRISNILIDSRFNQDKKRIVIRNMNSYSIKVIKTLVKTIHENKLISKKFVQDSYKQLIYKGYREGFYPALTYEKIDYLLYECLVNNKVNEYFNDDNLDNVFISIVVMFLTDSYNSYKYFINSFTILTEVQKNAFSLFVRASQLGKEQEIIEIFSEQTDLSLINNFYNSFHNFKGLFTHDKFNDEIERRKIELKLLFTVLENNIENIELEKVNKNFFRHILNLSILIDEEEYYYMGCKYLSYNEYGYNLLNFESEYVRKKVLELLDTNGVNRNRAYLQLKELNLEYSKKELDLLIGYTNSRKKITKSYAKDLLEQYNNFNDSKL